MDRKTYTVLITSNRKGRTQSITVSAAWLKALLLLGLVGIVVLSASLVDYVGLLLQSGENKRLKAKANYLERQFRVVESKVDTLEKSLERVNMLTKKVKIITNIDNDDLELAASIGPIPKVGQGMKNELEEREYPRVPASELHFVEDSLFVKKPLLDMDKGELHSIYGKGYSTLSIRIDKTVKLSKLREQSVLNLVNVLEEKQSLLNATPSIMPVKGWFTSRFGYRLDPFTGKPTMHTGLDIAASPGSPVFSPAAGLISYIGYEAGYGKIISIDHGNGVTTRFAHNSQVFVDLGQKVQRRDVIAAVGSTGRSSGPHLHYEVRIQGIPVDPFNYILDKN
ncbi:MAG: M23 family metallopeptidase [Bdellovibrionales bacterium]|nr:M23 family metallopeptidase [Bdellovibrionales bacterium]